MRDKVKAPRSKDTALVLEGLLGNSLKPQCIGQWRDHTRGRRA